MGFMASLRGKSWRRSAPITLKSLTPPGQASRSITQASSGIPGSPGKLFQRHGSPVLLHLFSVRSQKPMCMIICYLQIMRRWLSDRVLLSSFSPRGPESHHQTQGDLIISGIFKIGFFISLPVSPLTNPNSCAYYPPRSHVGFSRRSGGLVSSKAARSFLNAMINPAASETTLHVFNAAIALSYFLGPGPYLAAREAETSPT